MAMRRRKRHNSLKVEPGFTMTGARSPQGSRWVAMRSCRVGMAHCEVIAGHREPLRHASECRASRRNPLALEGVVGKVFPDFSQRSFE
jgi:hypothetical protein